MAISDPNFWKIREALDSAGGNAKAAVARVAQKLTGDHPLTALDDAAWLRASAGTAEACKELHSFLCEKAATEESTKVAIVKTMRYAISLSRSENKERRHAYNQAFESMVLALLD